MKKIPTLILLSVIIAISFLSCEKTKTETVEKIIHDTVFLKDTLFLHDTITNNDTMFLIDSIIFQDTLIMIDTIIIHDTVIINDTNEFAYLFKHYDLDRYEVLYYSFPLDRSSYNVCKMYSDQIGYEVIDEGLVCYPVWSEDGEHVYYIDYNRTGVIKKSTTDQNDPGELVYEIDRNVSFLKHHEILGVFMFQYKENGKVRLLAYDYNLETVKELSPPGAHEDNPTCSKVDDWIYFSKLVNGTKDIYRRKYDGSNEEVIYEEPEFNLSAFNISADGKFLITPKYKDGDGYVVFYDIKRRRIIHELKLPVDDHPLWASLSDDNKAIFFVNGIPQDYSRPWHIYRMALDGTQLFQMTNFTDRACARPLVK